MKAMKSRNSLCDCAKLRMYVVMGVNLNAYCKVFRKKGFDLLMNETVL